MHWRTLVLALTLAVPAAAAETPPERVVVVTGEATVTAVPDRAIVSAGVTNRGKTAREASDATNRAMERLLASLRDGGIAERDIRTDRLSLQPVHEDARSGGIRTIGFEASNTVRVTVRDVTKVSAVLDRVIAAGGNEISGIAFDVSERSRRLDEARAEAVQDAKRKAEVLAKAAGVGLGRAIRISEESRLPRGPMMMRAAPAAVSTPVSPGEETLHATVSVTFELMH
jgi:uncharacterized protein YggE